MANKLFTTTDRDAAHRKLEELLGMERDGERLRKKGEPTHPLAECREDTAAGEFSVWDGPEDWIPRPPEKREPEERLAQSDLDKLADLVVKKLIEKGAKP